MDDVDMMEIDADDPLDHTKAVKRLPVGQTVSSNKRGRDLSLDCSIGLRKKIRGKRLVKRPGGKFIIILDTNILIDHLNDLKTFLSNAHLVESCTLIIPLIVIQEMDSLKKSNQSYVGSFKFINEQLRAGSVIFSDKVWLKRQPADVVAQGSAAVDMIEINNDDRILKVSLLVNEVCQASENTVMLVTDDLNLRNKALATALKSTDWDGFCDKFGIENTCKAKIAKTIERLRSSTKKFQPNATAKSDKPCTSESKGESKSESIEMSTETYQYGDWLRLKYLAESKLRNFLETILKRVYNDLWDKIFKIDFANCTLFEIIRCIKQGWLGTFSDIFGRNKSVLENIESIFQLLKDEKETGELTCLVQQFLQSVYEVENDLQSGTSDAKQSKKKYHQS